MLWTSVNGQGLGVHVEFLGRHFDPSPSKGDSQISSEVSLLPARRDIDTPHNFFDEGPTLLTLTPYVLLKKSPSSGTWTRAL